VQPASGIEWGVDANALQNQNVSLELLVMRFMVLATALTETGSKMDEVILKNSKELVTWNCNWIELLTNEYFQQLI
jgi:transcription termination factor Rho